jgi:hypothetical protein
MSTLGGDLHEGVRNLGRIRAYTPSGTLVTLPDGAEPVPTVVSDGTV